MKHKLQAILTLLFISISTLILGQEHETTYIPETDPLVLQKLEEWEDLKFGLLMHWGPYSQWGVVESWSICAEDEDWCRRSNEDYIRYKEDYEKLQTTFDPTQFNPEKWAEAAAAAGMKYVVFTTKHHDGFAMFDTKQSDYKITSPKTPFSSNPGADVTLGIFNAFREKGMWTGAYFSKPDWHSEYYWWPNFATPDRNVNYSINNYPDRWEKFVQFTHNQVMELMTGYGRVDILWLDGGWVKKRSPEEIRHAYENMDVEKPTRIQNQDIRMDELVVKAREAQPGLIVVDRAVEGKNQNYLTPENRVPEKELPYPWESCIIAGGGWSWVPDPHFMTSREAVHLLIDIVAKGGNLLLNIAPGPHGDWHPGAYELLEGMAKWMKVNSEAIYGTRAIAPYRQGNVAVVQKGERELYIFCLLDEGGSLPERVTLEGITLPRGSAVEILGVGGKVRWESSSSSFTLLPSGAQVRKASSAEAVVFRVTKGVAAGSS